VTALFPPNYLTDTTTSLQTGPEILLTVTTGSAQNPGPSKIYKFYITHLTAHSLYFRANLPPVIVDLTDETAPSPTPVHQADHLFVPETTPTPIATPTTFTLHNFSPVIFDQYASYLFTDPLNTSNLLLMMQLFHLAIYLRNESLRNHILDSVRAYHSKNPHVKIDI
jgi:hypothetical protein